MSLNPIEIPEKERREIKSKLKIVKIDQPTYVILIVVHKNKTDNEIVRLQCRRLMPMEGYPFETKIVPVGGYVYDGSNDTYLVNCIDHLPLGQIPFSYKVVMDNVGQWSSFVPVPISIVKQHLETTKKQSLERFQSEYGVHKEDVNFQYIQFTSISQC